ncbi:hypothetical protein C8A05DRAFT_13627 [Staphylotrichum tortipilum]|uniref:Uncharacterized protein n=1 Tax=Staphylotrichum tortipilum TaxID=2831512 RepID=A0AAN6MQD3_9PEZI|nr:hypothetical protein C8A05DRAFT_13627 [Staphylotrichum longicolle]
MGSVKDFFRAIRAAFSRKKKDKAKEVSPEGQASDGGVVEMQPVIVHHAQGDDGGNVVGVDHVDHVGQVNSQLDSNFFNRFPLEIRRKIYKEAWRMYLNETTCGHTKPSSNNKNNNNNATATPGTDLRLHIFSPSSSNTRLAHTRCLVDRCGGPGGDDDGVDHHVAAPTSLGGVLSTGERHARAADPPAASPPRWFFEAWVLRLNWGGHWRCQRAVQRKWVPLGGQAGERAMVGEKAPFLRVFLTCKKMYLEAAQSFFEEVTLVFTTSTDAHAFFLQRPPPMVHHLRHLELSFTHTNDHLYLTKIVHDPGTVPGGRAALTPGGAPLMLATAAQVASTRARALARLARRNNNPAAASFHDHAIAAVSMHHAVPQSDPHRGGGHECLDLFCRVDLFGEELWRALARGMRRVATGLREMEITVAGRIPRNKILDVFGAVAEDERQGWGGVGPEGYWVLPGRLVARFTHWQRDYRQEGKKMVRIGGEK